MEQFDSMESSGRRSAFEEEAETDALHLMGTCDDDDGDDDDDDDDDSPPDGGDDDDDDEC